MEDIVDGLNIYFGKLTITCDSKNIFLWMNITIKDNGKFVVDKVEHLKEAIGIFDRDILRGCHQ